MPSPGVVFTLGQQISGSCSEGGRDVKHGAAIKPEVTNGATESRVVFSSPRVAKERKRERERERERERFDR